MPANSANLQRPFHKAVYDVNLGDPPECRRLAPGGDTIASLPCADGACRAGVRRRRRLSGAGLRPHHTPLRQVAAALTLQPCNPATLQPEPEPEPGKSLQRLWDAARPQFVDAATGEVRPGLDLLRAA